MSCFIVLFLSLASKLYNDDSSAMNFHNSEAIPFLHSIMPPKMKYEAEHKFCISICMISLNLSIIINLGFLFVVEEGKVKSLSSPQLSF